MVGSGIESWLQRCLPSPLAVGGTCAANFTLMSEKSPVLVVVAHPDDWQLFAGSAVYRHLRDPRKRVTIVTLSAGDAGDDAYHWKSRHSGAVLSIVRALPSWSPYTLGEFESSGVPSSFRVSYERAVLCGKAVLSTGVSDGAGIDARMFALHLPDGGAPGAEYSPARESLANLREGRCRLTALWPEDASVSYGAWSELVEVLYEIAAQSVGSFAGAVPVYASDPDPAANPGDHPDHVSAGLAVCEIATRIPQLWPAWISMYDVGNRAQNLDEAAAHRQRAAIFAYGAGYTANAAGARCTWRRGWEREYEPFKEREYVRAPDEG